MFKVINGEEITKHFFVANEHATDYVSLLTRRPSALSIRALEDTDVVELHYDRMQMLYETFPVWQKYGRLIAENIFLLICERAYRLLYYTTEENYLKLLEERPDIFEKVPQHYIASYLGIQPESLSRIRKRLMDASRVRISTRRYSSIANLR